MPGTIRAARPEEGPSLTELALRSKGYWGYDARFVEDCRSELTLTPRYVAENPVYVSEDMDGRVAGFYSLVEKESFVDLNHLYVEPSAIGGGHGRKLFAHAVETARRLGYQLMTIEADPHAETFYQAMGASRVGEVVSPVRAGRMLPLLHFKL